MLKKDGLSAIGFITDEVCCNLKMQLCGEELTILRSVLREDDGILTGTGDMIYIPNKKASVENFLKWYLSENIGNLLTVRPTYRWNGTRIYDSDVWQSVAELLSDMGIHYSHMLDGRELPGCDANPTKNDLDGKYFLGRQTHEFDGQYVYWGKIDITQKPSEEMFFDLFLRMYRRHPERMNLQYIPENIRFTDTQRCIFRAPTQPTDMKEAAEEFVRSLVATRKGNLRHTGPATLFKYFYEAGYKWLGAELMYTPTELTVSALRGANRVYGGKMGAHHAVQWSTSPHDTESRYKRYRLALFISYIQGIDEINTEEDLEKISLYVSTTGIYTLRVIVKDFDYNILRQEDTRVSITA